ncbi:catalase-related domain-containing protein [Bacillus cereus]
MNWLKIYLKHLQYVTKRIQNAMIEHFTQADEDYGRRVKEGIEKKMKEAKTENKLPGREVSKSKYGQGSLAANEATKDAVKKSHESILIN